MTTILLLILAPAFAVPASAGKQDAELSREVDRLVERLEADSIDDRDQAQESLTRLGRKIEPLIRARLKDAGHETRLRLEAVLKEMSRRERIQEFYPDFAPVTLDAEASLSEITALLGFQTSTRIELESGIGTLRVTARFKKTPILRVVDTICREAGLAYTVRCASGQTTVSIGKGPYVAFPRVFDERYSVWMESLRLSVRSDLRGGTVSESVLQFGGGWEGGTHPTTTRLTVSEILDDQGKSLLPLLQARDREAATGDATRFTVRLAGVPAPDVKKLRLVRGTLDLTFPSDLRILKFEQPANKLGTSVSGDGLHATLTEFGRTGELLRVVVRLRSGSGITRPAIRVRDRSGKELARSAQSVSRSRDTMTYASTFAIAGDSEIDSLEISVLVGTIERSVPFEFRDVPVRP